MIGYALGRTVLPSDKPLVESMIAAGGGASFSDLAIKIVTSRQFRHRAGEPINAPAATPAPAASAGAGPRATSIDDAARGRSRDQER